MSLEAAVKRSLAGVSTQTPPLGVALQLRVDLRASVPVVKVSDVARSSAWYARRFGFAVEAFPPQPPHEFAMLTRDHVQVMIRRGPVVTDREPADPHWDLFVRVGGGEIRVLFEGLRHSPEIVRPLEVMPYGDAEFELRDPDGLVICVGEHLQAHDPHDPAA